MSKITLYMDAELLDTVRASAEAAGLSVSAWLTQVVRQHTRREWPADVVALAGAWPDFPSADEIRGNTPDIPREPL